MTHRVKIRMVPPRVAARLVPLVVGGGVALLAAFVVAVAWLGSGRAEGDGEQAGLFLPILGLLSVLIIAAILAVGVLAATRRRHRRPTVAAPVPLETEQCILALASQTGAPLTAPQVALHCHISLADSKAALGRLADLGFAHAHITDQGDLAYRITGLESPNP